MCDHLFVILLIAAEIRLSLETLNYVFFFFLNIQCKQLLLNWKINLWEKIWSIWSKFKVEYPHGILPMGLFLTLPTCHSSCSMINPLGDWNDGQEVSWIQLKGKFAVFLSEMCWDLHDFGTKHPHSEDGILSPWRRQTRITTWKLWEH